MKPQLNTKNGSVSKGRAVFMLFYRFILKKYAKYVILEKMQLWGNNMRIAVCDDDPGMLTLMHRLTAGEFEKRHADFTVQAYPDAQKLLSDFAEKPFDVLFLDIKMPGIDGFEAARRVRGMTDETEIIFITTEQELVYDSFDFQPFAFIPKTPPELMKSRLSRTVGNLLAKYKVSRRICVELPYSEKIYIKPNDLIYVGSEKNNLIYHIRDGEDVLVRAKIQEAEEILPDDLFIRIHNRLIVNMAHIESIDYPQGVLTVTGGELLPISRPRKQSLSDAYDRYLRTLV